MDAEILGRCPKGTRIDDEETCRAVAWNLGFSGKVNTFHNCVNEEPCGCHIGGSNTNKIKFNGSSFGCATKSNNLLVCSPLTYEDVPGYVPPTEAPTDEYLNIS